METKVGDRSRAPNRRVRFAGAGAEVRRIWAEFSRSRSWCGAPRMMSQGKPRGRGPRYTGGQRIRSLYVPRWPLRLTAPVDDVGAAESRGLRPWSASSRPALQATTSKSLAAPWMIPQSRRERRPPRPSKVPVALRSKGLPVGFAASYDPMLRKLTEEGLCASVGKTVCGSTGSQTGQHRIVHTCRRHGSGCNRVQASNRSICGRYSIHHVLPRCHCHNIC
jgi:hypothetical protein